VSRNKLNSQQMFKMMSLYSDACLKSLSPLIDGLINDGLPKVLYHTSIRRCFDSCTSHKHLRYLAAYSRRTFPWTICPCFDLSSALWKNGGSYPDAVWQLRSDGSSDEADSGVWGSDTARGTFGSEFGARHYKPMGIL